MAQLSIVLSVSNIADIVVPCINLSSETASPIFKGEAVSILSYPDLSLHDLHWYVAV